MQPTRIKRWFPAFLLIVIASMLVAIIVSAIVQSKLLNGDIESRQVVAHAASAPGDGQRDDVSSQRIRVDLAAVRQRSGWVQAVPLWLLAPRQAG